MRPTVLPAVLAVAALTLTGCGGGQDTSAEPTTTTTPTQEPTVEPTPTPVLLSIGKGQTLYWTSTRGATGTVTFHADPDPQVSQYRALEGRAAPVVWADVDIDNRQGKDAVALYDVLLYTPEGEEITMTAADQQVTEWWNVAVDDPNYPEQLGDLAHAIDYDEVNAGQRATHKTILEGTIPEQVTRVAITLEGGEEVTTTPGAPPDGPTGDTTHGPAPMPEVTGGPSENQAVSLPTGQPVPPFTYDEALAAWQGGMPYYDAFCIHYTPTTPGGVSQCDGIEAGTVDGATGEYIGTVIPPGLPDTVDPGDPSTWQGKDGNGNDWAVIGPPPTGT